jgi:predicted transcriptional regulator
MISKIRKELLCSYCILVSRLADMTAEMLSDLREGVVVDNLLHDSKLKQLRLGRTADIVAAYVARNPIALSDIRNVITSVYASLDELAVEIEEKPSVIVPAISIKKSIHPDYLICLEDGNKVKMLKRYLRTNYGLTPAQYRAKWGLPVDYPMAAPNYTLARSEFAKKVGFGRKKPRARPRVAASR